MQVQLSFAVHKFHRERIPFFFFPGLSLERLPRVCQASRTLLRGVTSGRGAVHSKRPKPTHETVHLFKPSAEPKQNKFFLQFTDANRMNGWSWILQSRHLWGHSWVHPNKSAQLGHVYMPKSFRNLLSMRSFQKWRNQRLWSYRVTCLLWDPWNMADTIVKCLYNCSTQFSIVKYVHLEKDIFTIS